MCTHTYTNPPTYSPSYPVSHSQDTLVESGYSQEESEEVIARVLSVIDSTEHFLSQTTTVLEEVRLANTF